MFGQSGFFEGLGHGVENSVVEPAVRAPALPLKARKGFAIPAHHIGAAVRRHEPLISERFRLLERRGCRRPGLPSEGRRRAGRDALLLVA
jgi:hypothetical protein